MNDADREEWLRQNGVYEVFELREQLQEAQQARDEARLKLLWANGNAGELATLSSEIARWAEADRSQRGSGPSGGYDGRVKKTRRAQQLTIAALERLDAAEAQCATQAAHLKLLQWTADNIYTIARREANRVSPHPKWAHVLRLCEKAGCQGRGVLRAALTAPPKEP